MRFVVKTAAVAALAAGGVGLCAVTVGAGCAAEVAFGVSVSGMFEIGGAAVGCRAE